MPFEIIHLSDLHFGNPTAYLRRKEVDKVLDSLLAKVDTQAAFLVISGDVVFQGSQAGYKEALGVINAAIERNKVDRSRVLLCPGNHDIVQEASGRKYFTSFDEWSTEIRGDKSCTFADKPVQLIKNEARYFLLINSAFHADHKMGLIDISSVEQILRTLPATDETTTQQVRVAITHHHMIPVSPEDTSTTRNAYGLIHLLEAYSFSALLHGHQHAMLNINMGEAKMLLSGVGAFSYSRPGYMNTVAVYRGQGSIIENVERYGLTADSASGIVEIRS